MQNSVRRTVIISKIAVYLAVILWIFSAFNFFTRNKVDSEECIVQAFTNAALLDTSAKVSCMAEYKGNFKTIGEQEKLLKEAANVLGVSDYTINSSNDNETIKTTLASAKAGKSALLTFLSSGENQYISMEIQLLSKVNEAFGCKKNMEAAFKALGIKPAVRMHFQGSVRSNLKLETRNDIASALLADMKAKVVSENKDMDCYNIYAYADDLDEHMWIDGDKVNINLAMNYNEINDRTYIYLAVPMNNQDF